MHIKLVVQTPLIVIGGNWAHRIVFQMVQADKKTGGKTKTAKKRIIEDLPA